MKELPEKRGVLFEESDLFGEIAFRDAAIELLPDFEEELREFDGLHISMAVVARAARAAIADGRFDRVQAIYDFLERALAHPMAISEIRNAIAESFLEPAELRETANRHRALELMPAALRRLIGCV